MNSFLKRNTLNIKIFGAKDNKCLTFNISDRRIFKQIKIEKLTKEIKHNVCFFFLLKLFFVASREHPLRQTDL